jgi:maleate isomerase
LITISPQISEKKDALASRAKIGILVPASNTIVEPEMAAMQPPGVTNHVSRMSRVRRPAHDMVEYRKHLGDSVDMVDAIEVLTACAPDIIVHGHSVDSLAKGLDGADRMQKHMSELSGGLPVVLPAHALLKALDKLGRPQSLGILTPWMPPADEACQEFFSQLGYNVLKIEGLKHPTPLDIATATKLELNSAIDRINVDGVDCIIKVGTNSSMSFLVSEMEERLNKPVLTVNIITYWAGLRSLGITDRLTGFGMLASKY